MPKSYRTPHLILFYSDWCIACLQVEATWRRLIDELEPLGVGLATVHSGKESALARRLGIHSLPCLAVLMEGRTSMYKESMFSVQKIVGECSHQENVTAPLSWIFLTNRTRYRIPEGQVPIQVDPKCKQQQRGQLFVRLGGQ